ncbi:hypothetical protein GBA52_020600 [Prunus armeniaca]|nr:hypothetical protein GBA52_020600 [Prunus armeniaca]
MNFLWLLAVVVVIGIGVNGGVGHEDCRETRCRPDGPAIRFPFRLKGRQPIHCGFRGFDLSCTEYNETMLEMASSTKLLVDDINYRSHAIRGRAYDGCLPRELFYRNGSYPFQFIGRTPLFSCPPSTVRDKYGCGYGCLVRLNPCHGNNSGNHIYAVIGYCSIDYLPLMSCIKLHDYTSDPAYIYDEIGILHWSIPSCEHCKGILHSNSLV